MLHVARREFFMVAIAKLALRTAALRRAITRPLTFVALLAASGSGSIIQCQHGTLLALLHPEEPKA